MLLWITCAFLLLYAALICFYTYHWAQLKIFTPTTPPNHPFISVVVAARNEAANISHLLQALLHQHLQKDQYEIIVVDDYSTDATNHVVASFKNQQIRLIQPAVTAPSSSKKKAIEAGVAAARGPLIVVTDADCVPSPTWLSTMLSFYHQQQSSFIVAPVQLTANNSLPGIFQSLDFMMLQGITAAGIQAGAHSMCNGANLAYTKSAFETVNGFEGIDGRASGDDMLLLHKIWKEHSNSVHYLKSKTAIMPTAAMPTWKAFIAQRIRWSSKATYYQDGRITAVLFFDYCFNVWAVVLLVAAILQPQYWHLLLLYFVVKTIAELSLLLPVALFFSAQKKLWVFPLLQPLHVLYTVAIGLLSRKPTYEWKGRRTK